MTTTIALLRDCHLFSLLDDQECALLAERINIVEFPPGHVVFNVGDPGASMYIVTAGEVQLSVKTKTGEEMFLESPGPGEFFGEISLLDEGPRTATARTLTAVTAIEVDRGDLDELVRLAPATAMDLLSATGRRLRHNALIIRNAATRNVNVEAEDNRSAVMKTADWIAEFSGSLPFLFLHIGAFAVWILLNVGAFRFGGFDPFPFGFLTLVVSLEAIILSVFVLLSQNRQVARDKVRGDIEYDVNLKAEMQIAHMHEKHDQMYSELTRRLERMERRIDGERVAPSSPG